MLLYALYAVLFTFKILFNLKILFMKHTNLVVALLLLITSATAQKTYFVKASAGRVVFGTGDVNGFGAGVELSTPLSYKKGSYWQHFQAGAEMNFENGALQPVVINPTMGEFYHAIFNHVSNTTIYPKLTYYPLLRTFLKGINVSAGPSAGYSYQSREFQADGVPLQGEGAVRRSYLEYKNTWLIGFRITAGYEYLICKKLLVGGRLDFFNYQNHDANTMIAGKLGLKL